MEPKSRKSALAPASESELSTASIGKSGVAPRAGELATRFCGERGTSPQMPGRIVNWCIHTGREEERNSEGLIIVILQSSDINFNATQEEIRHRYHSHSYGSALVVPLCHAGFCMRALWRLVDGSAPAPLVGCTPCGWRYGSVQSAFVILRG